MKKSNYKEHPMQRNAYLKQAIAFAQRMIEDGVLFYKAIKIACVDYNCDTLKLTMGIKKKPKATDRLGGKEMPVCASCGDRQRIKIVMRLDSIGRPQHMWWCPECVRCVVYNGKPFIGKDEIESMGIDIEQIEEVRNE